MTTVGLVLLIVYGIGGLFTWYLAAQQIWHLPGGPGKIPAGGKLSSALLWGIVYGLAWPFVMPAAWLVWFTDPQHMRRKRNPTKVGTRIGNKLFGERS